MAKVISASKYGFPLRLLHTIHSNFLPVEVDKMSTKFDEELNTKGSSLVFSS